MLMVVCVVKDSAVDQYGTPQFVRSSGEAVRGFTDAVKNKQEGNLMAGHPDDFDLFKIGTYESDTSEVKWQLPELLVRGKDIV